MKPLISIIVPVYNVEKYLDKCVFSLVNQTYKEIEILLVDDESPDNCPQICEEWKERDSRIRVIHKKNGGQSDARNVGIDNSRGKYLLFVDSDDYVSEDHVEYLYNLLASTGSDISVGRTLRFFEGTNPQRVETAGQDTITMTSEEALVDMLYEKHFATGPMAKLCKKELFEGISFPLGKKYEDLSTIYKVIVKCNTVVYGSKVIYYYLVRNDSTIGTLNPIKNKDFIMAAKEVHNYVTLNVPVATSAADFKLFQAAIEMLVHYPKTLHKDSEDYSYKMLLWSYVKKYRWQIMFDKSCKKKYRLISMAALFGQNTLTLFYNTVSRR